MRDAVGRARTAKLGLSAARFGGPSTAEGRGVDVAEARAILAFAAEADLKWLVAGRGEAERTLAKALPRSSDFRLCLKAPLAVPDADALEREALSALVRLDSPAAEALIIRAQDLTGSGADGLWTRMRRLQEAGAFRRLGISARAIDDPLRVVRRFDPDLMQLSVSLLDQRLIQSGALPEIAGLGVEVHLRSTLQDGLLFLPRERLSPALAEAGPRLSRIRRAIAEAGADPLQAALSFVLGRPEASAVLVGVASCAELRAVVAAAASGSVSLDWQALALERPELLDGDPWRPEAVAA